VKEKGLEGSFWPSEQQKLLLRTAFAGADASAEAWRSLRPRLDLDRLEPGSFPVLPLVHRGLERLKIEDPCAPRLAGIRRRTWYLNRVQLAELMPALHAIEETGAAPVVVSGWQLLAHHYDGDFGLRPVDGLEALVPPHHIHACAGALAQIGFVGPDNMAGRVARFVRADGRTCSLHERLAREFSVPERGLEPEDLWEKTFDLPIGGTRARALAPSDDLVQLCLGGARATRPPSILWVADALAVLQASGAAVDWDRLLRHAIRLRAMLRLRDALLYLRRELDAPVPEGVIRELEASSPRPRELFAHRGAGRSRRRVRPWPRAATRFLHVTADRPMVAAFVALPTFLRDELGLRRRRQVPFELVRRATSWVLRSPEAQTRQPPIEAK
jgi:Uncharacterised nucleotidyltransferase